MSCHWGWIWASKNFVWMWKVQIRIQTEPRNSLGSLAQIRQHVISISRATRHLKQTWALTSMASAPQGSTAEKLISLPALPAEATTVIITYQNPLPRQPNSSKEKFHWRLSLIKWSNFVWTIPLWQQREGANLLIWLLPHFHFFKLSSLINSQVSLALSTVLLDR